MLNSPPQPSSSSSSSSPPQPPLNLYCLLLTSLLSLLFLLSLSPPSPPFPLSTHHHHHHHLRRNLIPATPTSNSSTPSPPPPHPPRLAYFISGSDGDAPRILRLLFAIYHPRNSYLLHLDFTAPQSQREYLATWVESHAMFGRLGPFRNVFVMGKPDFVYPNDPSSISSALHGASLLLKLGASWDWLVSLSACDYPLLTQDDLLHILSYLPKDFNFVNHSSDIGSRELRRMKRVAVDPGLYLSEKSELFYATQKRELPNAFRLFTGSASAILSRDFVEFCITATNNFPRTLLMYLSNTPSSQANYFPTILCNVREFKKTVVNHSLHFASWTEPPKREKRQLGLEDLNSMILSGSAFGSGFATNDPVLNKIDRKLLHRKQGSILPGGWCLGETDGDSCTSWGDPKILRPGPGARRLEKRLVEVFSNGTFRSQQCV